MDQTIVADDRFFSRFSLIKKSAIPWLMCITAGMFYCYNFYLRVAPNTMSVELMKEFQINATEIGLLNTAYYVSYTFMQIPVGFILDRFNIRWVLFFACLVVILGLGIFISAETYSVAALARFLIGLGCAFSYLSVLKLATIWLPPNRFAIMAGLTTFMGKGAAAFSTFYLTYAVANDGFRVALSSALIVGLGITGLIFTVVRGKDHSATIQPDRASTRELVQSIGQMVRSKQMWLIGLVGLLLYLPSTVFIDQWGNPYLKAVHGLNSSEAAWCTNLIIIGWAISSPLTGMLSDILRQRRMPLIITSLIATVLFLFVFYGPSLSKIQLYTIMFTIGAACGSHPLCFSLAKENNLLRYSGISTAVTNSVIMAGGLFQGLVGSLLDLHFSGEIVDSIRVYTNDDYTFALSIIPMGCALAILLSFFIKETHCRLKEDDRLP